MRSTKSGGVALCECAIKKVKVVSPYPKFIKYTDQLVKTPDSSEDEKPRT